MWCSNNGVAVTIDLLVSQVKPTKKMCRPRTQTPAPETIKRNERRQKQTAQTQV